MKLWPNFALVPRTRSSHNFAKSSDANFGFKSGTTGMELLVSFIDSEVRKSAPQMLTNFGIGTLVQNRTATWHLRNATTRGHEGRCLRNPR